ncbi:MAG: single-stranded DNA-binding protein [Gammaproteobacteria bacterium]|nr:single-stranded DNA-binding protein [Gammaproteobacteria bacterium]
MMFQNECNITGEIKERLSLQWTKNRFPFVDFFLLMTKIEKFKKIENQTIRCICHGPQAIYIAEKIEQGEQVIVKGSLDSKCRKFEDGFYYEITIAVKQCYPVRQSYQTYTAY